MCFTRQHTLVGAQPHAGLLFKAAYRAKAGSPSGSVREQLALVERNLWLVTAPQQCI